MTTRLLLAVTAALLALSACSPAVGDTATPRAAAVPDVAGSVQARVVQVVDGDTVHDRTADGADLDVRVIGEDSPETRKPRTPVQCGGPEASAEAHRVLDGQTVTLVVDPTQGGREHVDRYGRALRYVTLPNGEDLSVHMVAGGWSRAYKVSGPVPAKWAELTAVQDQARAAQRGLWGPPCRGGV